MTESTHPSDEQLSAAIDGADDAAAAHAEACGRCSYRLSAMRSVADAISTPPVGDQLLRGRVLAAAMQHDVDEPGIADNAKRLASAPWLVGIAAALLAALLVVPMLTGSDSQSGDSVAVPAAGDAEFRDTHAEANNLGSFRDPKELGSVVAGLIGDQTTADGVVTGGGSAGRTESGEPGSTVAPASGDVKGGGAMMLDSESACASTVEREYGQTMASLVYSGVLVWQDKPAVLLAYRVEGAQGPLDHRLFVLSEADCTLFTALSI